MPAASVMASGPGCPWWTSSSSGRRGLALRPEGEVALGLLLPLSLNDRVRSIPCTLQVHDCILLRRSRPPSIDDNIANFTPSNVCLEPHRSLSERQCLPKITFRDGLLAMQPGVLTVPANLARPTDCLSPVVSTLQPTASREGPLLASCEVPLLYWQGLAKG